jgi:hypothetical protein
MADPITVKIGGEEITLPLIMNFATLERVGPALTANAAATTYNEQISACVAFLAAVLLPTRPDLTVPEIKNRLRINLVDGTDERAGVQASIDAICIASGLVKRKETDVGEAVPPEAPAAELPTSI